ncbi:MAG: hypothetical protein AMJ53_18580 [Gammaproteobacteria bacterium SG8_11]|nr:MAG: hypothetical protein AMJ53_18580 [Gammaproteobacteria bacterium SG8_11]
MKEVQNMHKQFEIGERVWVRDDEGLDVPTEAQGKYGIVSGYLYGDDQQVAEYWVKSTNNEFPIFNAASYHIAHTTVNGTIPELMKAEFRAAIGIGDPDLWGMLELVKNDPGLPEFHNVNITTVAFESAISLNVRPNRGGS